MRERKNSLDFTAEEIAANRAAWQRLPARSTAVRARIALACIHLGEPIDNEAAAKLGLSTERTWRPCAQGHGEEGHVCGCKPTAWCKGCSDFQTTGKGS